MARRRGNPEKKRARWMLEQAVRAGLPKDAEVTIDRIRYLERGLSSKTYSAVLEATPDPDQRSGRYVVRMSTREADDERESRLRREAALLRALTQRELPYRIPAVVLLVGDDDGLAMVQRFLGGLPLNEARRSPSCPPPWEVAGEVAAAVHQLDPEGLPLESPPHPTRRQYARDAIEELAASGDPLLRDAYQWALAHLPPDAPLCVIHGDLLAQNLLVDLGLSGDTPLPPGVLDWEYARLGDPAEELSVLTRGVRRPFGEADGLHQLIHAYRKAGGLAVTANDVRLFELILVGAIYRNLIEDRPWEAEQHGHQIRRILREAD